MFECLNSHKAMTSIHDTTSVSETRIVPAGEVWAISCEKFRRKSRKVWLNYFSFAHRVKTHYFKSQIQIGHTTIPIYYSLQASVCTLPQLSHLSALHLVLKWNKKKIQNQVNNRLPFDILNQNTQDIATKISKNTPAVANVFLLFKSTRRWINLQRSSKHILLPTRTDCVPDYGARFF